jgi:peptidoglycan/LPS O-acetylase OafA/YrhL
LEPHDRFRSGNYFGSLDALRCFAILAVIWQHSPGMPLGESPFTEAGVTGVGLFFVLSGFLITTLLLREESRTGRMDLKAFYIRRSLRIFPLYYAVLGLYTALVLLMENNAAGRLFLANLPYYLTYTSNWFVDLMINDDGQRRVIFVFAWSLATEEQFYLFWPVLLCFAPRRIAIATLVAVMAIDFLLTFAFGRAESPTSYIDRLLRIATSPATEICAGVLLALALHSRSGFERIWPWLGRAWSAPATAGLALLVITWPGSATTGWHLALAVSLTLVVASCVIREDHGLAPLLQLPVLARIGVVSYGIYMLHSLAINVVKAAFAHFGANSPPLGFVLAVALSYVSAEISFRLFESPLLRMKARFNAKSPNDSSKT